MLKTPDPGSRPAASQLGVGYSGGRSTPGLVLRPGSSVSFIDLFAYTKARRAEPDLAVDLFLARFDESEITSLALARAAEQRAAEAEQAKEERVLNEETDALPAADPAAEAAPASRDPQVAARLAAIAQSLVTDPENLLHFAEGVIRGFAEDGLGGTIELVTEGVPAAGSWLWARTQEFGWGLWALARHPL